MTQSTTATTDDAAAPFGTSTSATGILLACAAVAGPLYEVVFLVQAFTRPGFDVARHTGSLLSLGDLGWVQVATFVVTGLLLVAGAVGMRPVLLGLFALSFVAAGVSTPDPMGGFPPGTPPGPPAGLSWHAGLHFLAGAVGFLALPAACPVLARPGRRVDHAVYAHELVHAKRAHPYLRVGVSRDPVANPGPAGRACLERKRQLATASRPRPRRRRAPRKRRARPPASSTAC